MKEDGLENKPKNLEEENNTGTDAQKITRRHMEDEDDIITDEDIRNIKIGPLREVPSTTGAELEEIVREKEEIGELKEDNEEVDEENEKNKKDEQPPSKPMTPWDTIDG